MNQLALSCTACRAPLPAELINRTYFHPCPRCGAAVHVDAFPALFRPLLAGSAGERVGPAVEASCFYHPQKRAVVPCASCGRFLCALCDLELNDEHLCPACLEAGQKKGKLARLENEHMCYDRLVLWTALLPLLVWPLTLVTAPATLVMVVRYWRSPPGMFGRGRWRFVLAALAALAELAGWIALFYLVTTR